jgi:GntR family transcriptional regulator
MQDVIPLYFRIYVVLEQRIRAGEWPEGVSLPSEQELAAQFNVSRVTIRNTMALLEEARLVLRQRGRGTFVNAATLSQNDPLSFSGMVENIQEFESNSEVTLHEFGEVDVPGPVRRLVGDGLGERALRIVRTRRAGQAPFSYSECYVAQPEAQSLSAETLGNRTVIAALETAGFIAARADQRLTAVLADSETALYLEQEVGAPLIGLKRFVYDASDRLVEFIQIYYRPDRFEYRVGLSREANGGLPPRWVPLP